MNLKDWNLDKNDRIYLILLFLITLLAALKMLDLTMKGCISNPDIALYLINSLKYAGLDLYNIANSNDMVNTPIICYLTSLIFRTGYVDKNAIIIITSLFNFIGFFGFYILLKNRFNPQLSFIGTIIYGSLPIILVNAYRGMIDLPSISISIWILVFGIMAIDKNPKYFLITLPLFTIGFFTKYIAGLTLPLIVLYYVMNRNVVDTFDDLISDKKLFKQKFKNYVKSKEFKYILISSIIALIIGFIIIKTLILDFNAPLSFIKQTTNTFNGYDYSPTGIDYNMDSLYYINHFSSIIYETNKNALLLSTFLYTIFGFGLILGILRFIKNINHFKFKKELFKTKYFDRILSIVIVILIFISLYTINDMPNHMISNVSLLVALTLIFSKLIKHHVNNKILSIDILILAYFLINLIFISLYAIKVPRYILPAIPPFIYFIIWGLNSIYKSIGDKKLFNFKLTSYISSIILIIFLIFTISFIISPMEYDQTGEVYRDVYDWDFKFELIDISNFIINNDNTYHNKTFASDYHHSKLYKWYLNNNVSVLNTDKSIKNFKDTDYIITTGNDKISNYTKIYKNDKFYLYKHKTK